MQQRRLSTALAFHACVALSAFQGACAKPSEGIEHGPASVLDSGLPPRMSGDAGAETQLPRGGTSGIGGAGAPVTSSDAGSAVDDNDDASVRADAAVANNDDPCGPRNPAAVSLPQIGAAHVDVRDHGAKGDGVSDDTSALQAALTIAAAGSGGVVHVPDGTYLSGPLTLSNSTRLELAKGATLKMLPRESWPGTTPFITADNAHDIALSGAGTIEGQGQAWWNALTDTPDLKRPQEVSFSNSMRVEISGVHLQGSPEEHIWVKGDVDVTITGISIQTLAIAGQHKPSNTDGVDVTADGLFFCGNNIACGDDNLVLSGSHLYAGHSSFGVGHGCSIGSITKKGVSDVTVDHITFHGTTSGIRMKSARDRGGPVKSLTFTNIHMSDVENPVFITSYYPKLPTDPTSDASQAVTATTPYWQDIRISDLTSTGSKQAGVLWGLPEAPIMNIVFERVTIEAQTGMQVFHANGVSFNDSSVRVSKAPEVIVSDADVQGIATHKFP